MRAQGVSDASPDTIQVTTAIIENGEDFLTFYKIGSTGEKALQGEDVDDNTILVVDGHYATDEI